MRELAALRNIIEPGVLILAITLVFLEILSVVSNFKTGKKIDPLNTAKIFFETLAAHQYTEALCCLTQELHQSTDEGDLKSQMQAIEDLHHGIWEVVSLNWRKEGDTVLAELLIKTGNSEQNLAVPMKKEGGDWKVASLKPLHQLVVIGARGTVHKI